MKGNGTEIRSTEKESLFLRMALFTLAVSRRIISKVRGNLNGL